MGNSDMGREKRIEFLTGQFAEWFAIRDGREKPNKDDKKRAAIVASSAHDTFDYYDAQRRVAVAA